MMKKITIKKLQAVPKRRSIKVRLDHRTIIVLKHISALEAWKKKYPKARVMAA